MRQILILDYVCPKPYCAETLSVEPLGGTEATVVRVASALQGTTMWNHHTPNSECDPTHVVVLRAPDRLLEVKARYPRAKLYLWLHDLPTKHLTQYAHTIAETETEVITVSNFHRNTVMDYLSRAGVPPKPISVRMIYNPIDDHLKRDNTPVKANKLVFFSSPHKGLDYTLSVFKNLENFEELKGMKLYVANPGYFDSSNLSGIANVVSLGELPHQEVIKHVREALCVFHLNPVFPETFGLVYAEANAVGTPFLTHNLGATSEVSDHPAQLLDTKDPKKVIDRLISWRAGARPKVFAQERFRLANIVKQWDNLFK